jgi:chaperonin GroEL (HSP60 family)
MYAIVDLVTDGLIAVLKCINDGSIVPGGEVSLGALKTAIKAQL